MPTCRSHHTCITTLFEIVPALAAPPKGNCLNEALTHLYGGYLRVMNCHTALQVRCGKHGMKMSCVSWFLVMLLACRCADTYRGNAGEETHTHTHACMHALHEQQQSSTQQQQCLGTSRMAAASTQHKGICRRTYPYSLGALGTNNSCPTVKPISSDHTSKEHFLLHNTP